MLAFGPRSSLGQFQLPIVSTNGWGRDVFSFALAIQNLLWGVGQPFAGAIADRYGTIRVLCGGALLYAAGLALMVHSTTPTMFTLSAGVLIGFGLSGCSFNLVIGAFGKLVPEKWRSLAFGAGTAAGSFGQFLFSPFARFLIDGIGWQNALLVFAVLLLLILPLSIALATPTADKMPAGQGAGAKQSARQALVGSVRSSLLRAAGARLLHLRLSARLRHRASAGLSARSRPEQRDRRAGPSPSSACCNIVGSLSSGWLATRMPKRYLLSAIYFARALSIVAFIPLPATPTTAIIFGAVTGLFWLSTVPPTSGLVALMFGTRWLAMLFGFAFFSHQVGGFLGV